MKCNCYEDGESPFYFWGGNLVVDLDRTINSAVRELVGPTNKEVSSHGVWMKDKNCARSESSQHKLQPLFWPFQGRLSQPASYTNNASGNNIFKLGGREWCNAKSSTFCSYLWVKKTLEVRRNSTFVGDRKANKYSGPISVRIWKKQFQKILNSVHNCGLLLLGGYPLL